MLSGIVEVAFPSRKHGMSERNPSKEVLLGRVPLTHAQGWASTPCEFHLIPLFQQSAGNIFGIYLVSL